MDWNSIEAMVKRIAEDAERAADCGALSDDEIAEWSQLLSRLDVTLQKFQAKMLAPAA